MNTLCVGMLRGDEGKGRATDYLANDYDASIRYNGGNNAGHTLYINNNKLVLHLIPDGILRHKYCIIGNGCVINLRDFAVELNDLIDFILLNNIPDWEAIPKTFDDVLNELNKLLKIAYNCHVTFKAYLEEDTDRENVGKGNGSTKKGIAQTYREKANRTGLRLYDVISMYESLKDGYDIKDEKVKNVKRLMKEFKHDVINLDMMFNFACDTEKWINENASKMNYLFEGAQGILLDIDSPYYPNVSSSSVGVGGIMTGTGISYKNLMKQFKVIGIVKSYMSSVGVGTFLTEIKDQIIFNQHINIPGYKETIYTAEQLREAGHEYGSTTGRPRKVGFFDIPLLRYAIRTTGVDEIFLTRLDTLMQAFPKNKFTYIPVCIAYHNLATDEILTEANIWELNNCVPLYAMLPTWNECSLNDENFKFYIDTLESLIDVPIKYISVGPNREELIIKD